MLAIPLKTITPGNKCATYPFQCRLSLEIITRKPYKALYLENLLARIMNILQELSPLNLSKELHDHSTDGGNYRKMTTFGELMAAHIEVAATTGFNPQFKMSFLRVMYPASTSFKK